MEVYVQLFLIGLIPVALTILFALLKERGIFDKLSTPVQIAVLGLSFGGASVLGTVLGVNIEGAIINARDAAPLCAGLIFSGPAGIIAGVIGGAYRFVATYWGAGAYSQWACTISTMLAGLFAAFLRKVIFENKRPTWIFGAVTALVVEVLHMSILFLTHLDNVEQAYSIVKICTIPMVVCNAVSVFLAIVLTSLVTKSNTKLKERYSTIAAQVQIWLLLVVVAAYLLTTTFVFGIQTSTANRNAEEVIDYSIQEIKEDMPVFQDNLSEIAANRHVGTTGYIIVTDSGYKIISDSNIHGGANIGSDIASVGFKDIKSQDEDKVYTDDIYGVKSRYKFIRNNGSVIISVMPEEEVFIDRENSLYINSYMEVIAFASLFIVIYGLLKALVVDKIKTVNESLGKIINGDLSVEVNVKSSEEFYSLSKDINTTVDTLKTYIDEAKKRIDGELEFAKTIQHSSLPFVFPAYPDIKDFDIYAFMETAKEVGGDFYDFFLLGETKLAFLVADVSGKGIPAAMFMMRAKTLIKSLTESGKDLDEVFSLTNNSLCAGNEAGMFVTCFMGIFNYATGELRYVNAGHNPPYICRKDKGIESLKGKRGFVLAGMENMKYSVNEVWLNRGDKILLYTDGVVEAIDEQNNLYTDERLIKYFGDNCNLGVKDIILGIKADVDAFAGANEQFDDITMLMISYENKLQYKDFSSDESSFESANEFVHGELVKQEVSSKIMNQIGMAFEEMYINVCHYAYETEGTITVGAGYFGDEFVIKIMDGGVPFNPLEKTDPNISLNAEERGIGGLGIFITKKTMDNVSYEYRNNKNVLTIEKRVK